MEKIWGIYLNNLHYGYIHSIYKEIFPKGILKNKVDRINEILKLDGLPPHDYIKNYLFGGRVSVQWVRLLKDNNNKIETISDALKLEPFECYEKPIMPKLNDELELVHSFPRKEKLYMTVGTGSFKNHFSIVDYSLEKSNSEYFAYAVIIEDDEDSFLEIHSDRRLVLKIIKLLTDKLGLKIDPNGFVPSITMDKFLEFKGLLPKSRIRKYRGRSVDDSKITEIFEYTAKQNVDYANETEFQNLIEDLEDQNLTIAFEYDGSEYTIRIGLLSGSVYFQSYASEDAIDFVFNAFKETFLKDN